MKPSVYIETSIPSFYYETRPEPENVARREWPREWWSVHLTEYDAYTSEAVIEELDRGSFPGKDDALKLMGNLPLLNIRVVPLDNFMIYKDIIRLDRPDWEQKEPVR